MNVEFKLIKAGNSILCLSIKENVYPADKSKAPCLLCCISAASYERCLTLLLSFLSFLSTTLLFIDI